VRARKAAWVERRYEILKGVVRRPARLLGPAAMGNDTRAMTTIDTRDRAETGQWHNGARDLVALAIASTGLEGVRKHQLRPGETLIVRTRNSLYSIDALGGGEFAVSGGWFTENGDGVARVSINGCTWGGQAILTDMLAAPGLFLEFGNGVRTTRIRTVSIVAPDPPVAAN
jgi:hypothetical protein